MTTREKLEVPMTGRPKVPEWVAKPPPGNKVHVHLVLESDAVGKRIPISCSSVDNICVIGRHAPSCDIALSSPSVSRRQAVAMFDTEGCLWIADLGSQNGTHVGRCGKLTSLCPTKIESGDRILFGEDGPWILVVERTDDEAPPDSKRQKKKQESESEEKTASTTTRVRCAHILIKHSKSRNPTSWQTAGKFITRSEEEAYSHLRSLRQMIVDGTREFGDLARSASECKSAAHGGDLGFFSRGRMQKPFEDTAFALKIGELSDIIKTESGLHIILRLA